MHPRVCLHQVGFMAEPSAAFIAFCAQIGVAQMTLVDAAAPATPGVANFAHPFARYPDLERDSGEAAARLDAAIAAAARLGAGHVYIVSGGRGALSWEEAAARLAELIAPGRATAAVHGIALSIETANFLNADIHFAHTIDDALRAAETAGIDLTIDLGASWFEGDLKAKFRRALPRLRLVQVSDQVAGDRATPCRAVPGDGMVPLERILGDLLDCGYEGLFDLELLGPRIAAEGHRAAFTRAAENLSELLTKLGA